MEDYTYVCPNPPLCALIIQTLGEDTLKDGKLRDGSVTRFAEVFEKFSKVPTSRQSVHSWLKSKGVPLERCGHAERLSRKHARLEEDVLCIRKLRPDIYY